jgi:methylated-DNA-[protein]-cysteine S-methyltransferase
LLKTVFPNESGAGIKELRDPSIRNNSGRIHMDLDQYFYVTIDSSFDPAALVWWRAPSGPRVLRVFLSGRKKADGAVRERFPGAQPGACPEMDRLAVKIRGFLEGQSVVFDLDLVALEICGEFQRKILLAEYAIPRGWVSTYGRLAGRAGAPGGARAAGRALAENPFPLIIPCHRAVRSDGALGGFQGGMKMKRALLEMEGVEFKNDGSVAMRNVYYGHL